MICLSQSYPDSSVSSDNENLYIKYYKLVRFDHHRIVNTDGVCSYFRKSLPPSCLSNPYIKEFFIIEVFINNKRVYVL